MKDRPGRWALLGEPVPHESHTFLYILQSEALTTFVLDYLLKEVCIQSSILEKLCLNVDIQAHSLWGKGVVILFTVQYNKNDASLQSMVKHAYSPL